VVAVSDPLALLRRAYGDLGGLLAELTPDHAWTPTGCRGWAVLDLVQHLLHDAQRGLVALCTPATGPADTDAVEYWRAWQPEPGDGGVWRTRVVASAAEGLADLVGTYAGTTAAVLVAATRVDATDLVATQGHVLPVADLLSSLVVETAVHHLDAVAHLDRPGPADGPLAEVRRVLVGLHGGVLPERWDDRTAALRGTGRAPLTDADRADLGAAAGRFPLFG